MPGSKRYIHRQELNKTRLENPCMFQTNCVECVLKIWIFIQVKNEYSRGRRPLVDFLGKIECFARANSAWSASLQNEYRKLYVCTSMSAHMLAEYQPTD